MTNKNSIQEEIKCRLKVGINTKKYHVFAPMGRFQLESIYLYFPGTTVENKGKLILIKVGNSCYYSVQTLLSSRLLTKNLKIKI